MGIPGLAGLIGGMPMMTGGANDPMTKKARELYIGNLPDGVPEAQLMSFLNAALLQAGMNSQPGMPITSVRCNGRFAFAEFRSGDECTNALNLNGIILVGHALNVGRPSAYTGPPTQHIRWEQLMAAKIAENPELRDTAIGMSGAGAVVGGSGGHSCVGDPATKVCRELYIGNMPEGINELQLVEFFNAEMNRCGWTNTSLPGPACVQARINGRFAFVEFRTVEETDKGLQLNGTNFSGCSLRVGRPKAYTGPPGSQPAMAATAGMMSGLGALGNLGMAVVPTEDPTKCIQMKGMVTLEELQDDEEYADIVEDVKEEMDKYGSVQHMEIPRPAGEVTADHASIGVIYIKYAEVADAIKAQQELEGRTFGGNNVQCNFYPEDKFDAREWIDVVQEREKEAKAKEEAAATANETETQPQDGAESNEDARHQLPADLLGGAAPVMP